MVTHNQEIVDSMQKRVITLDQGVVARDDEAGSYKRQYAPNYGEVSQKMQEELIEAAREGRNDAKNNIAVSGTEAAIQENFVVSKINESGTESTVNTPEIIGSNQIKEQINSTPQMSENEEYKQTSHTYHTLAEAMQQGNDD